jgi:hypothetical protein
VGGPRKLEASAARTSTARTIDDASSRSMATAEQEDNRPHECWSVIRQRLLVRPSLAATPSLGTREAATQALTGYRNVAEGLQELQILLKLHLRQPEACAQRHSLPENSGPVLPRAYAQRTGGPRSALDRDKTGKNVIPSCLALRLCARRCQARRQWAPRC